MKKTYSQYTNSRGDFQSDNLVVKGSGREYNYTPRAQKTVDASFVVFVAGILAGLFALVVNFL